MYYYDRLDSMYHSRPIHYTSDKPTGLVERKYTAVDKEEEQVLGIIREYQIGNVVNNGFDRGI